MLKTPKRRQYTHVDETVATIYPKIFKYSFSIAFSELKCK